MAEEYRMEDPRIENLKIQLTRVREGAASGPDDPISDELLNVEAQVREWSNHTDLGKIREEMPHWTDTLHEWLDSIGAQLSADSARGLYYYLREVKRQMEILSTSDT